MKTNKIYKLFTILLILVVTMFSFGCGKSQEEQFTSIYDETAKMYDEFGNTIRKIENDNIDVKTMHKKVKKEVYEYDEKFKKQLEKLEKLAKGNAKLEKGYKGIKYLIDSTMSECKYKINKNEEALFQ